MAKKTLRRISDYNSLRKTTLCAGFRGMTDSYTKTKDTVATDEEHNEIDGDQDARDDRASICHNAIVHDGGPILSCKDLRGNDDTVKKQQQIIHDRENCETDLT